MFFTLIALCACLFKTACVCLRPAGVYFIILFVTATSVPLKTDFIYFADNTYIGYIM